MPIWPYDECLNAYYLSSIVVRAGMDLRLGSNTGLDADGMREVCAALKENNSLVELNLSRNRFGEEGAAMLESVLDHAQSLGWLDVRR